MSAERMSDTVTLRVSGDWACFTRPEFKLERVSYDALTPTAARGILEAVLWHPEFRWVVERVRVLKPIRYVSVRRNEVDGTFPARLLQGDLPSIDISDPRRRLQRHSLLLADVDYVVEARIALTEKGAHQPLAKYVGMFQRRVARGQHFRPPVLGCREFIADVTEVDRTRSPIAEDRDLGSMPLMIWRAGRVDPLFYPARMVQGVIEVPLAGQL